MITVWELEDALRDCEIIENYLDDTRGESCLVLGFCESKPIHAVCTIRTDPENYCSSPFMILPSDLINGLRITGKGGDRYA